MKFRLNTRLKKAIVDHDPDRVTDPPASFATLEALDEFCRSHPNAALRMIELSA